MAENSMMKINRMLIESMPSGIKSFKKLKKLSDFREGSGSYYDDIL